MSENAQQTIRFQIKLELLEDLHAGSGLASVWVDRPLVRDSEGQPFIPASHVKGVWRDVANRLCAMQVEGFTAALIDDWFGAAPKHEKDATAPRRGRLHCPRLTPTDRNAKTLVWTQSSRVPHSRRPQDDTLRSTEYLAACTTLVGEGYFLGTQNEFTKLNKLVARVDRYGGNRSRGDGRVRLVVFEAIGAARQSKPSLPSAAAHGIRLLLRARAPVQVPRTGSPGNLIECETRIPGRMLAGALIETMRRQGTEVATLFSGAAHIGDALPLDAEAPGTSDELARLEVMPAPLQYVERKPERKPTTVFTHMPGWANDASHTQSTQGWRDRFDARSPQDTQETPQPQYKRLPAGTYIRRNGPSHDWRAYRQPLEIAMRNRRGSDTGGHPKDRRNTPAMAATGFMDEALFSTEQMPVDTCFVADIQPGADSAQWNAWYAQLSKSLTASPICFVGRGGAAVEVVMACALPDPVQRHGTAEDDAFRLTLTSDAIVRTPWLGFHRRLTLQALCDALDIDVPEDTRAEEVSESSIDRAFNASTGLPRPSVIALRRGSSIRVDGTGASTLRAALSSRNAIGERQHEGMGRFRLDFNIGAQPQPSNNTKQSAPPAELMTEVIACKALDLAERHRASCKALSKSQWGNVRTAFDAMAESEVAVQIGKLRQQLADTANRTKGGEPFKGIADANAGLLAELARLASGRNAWSIESIRLALRLVMAQTFRPTNEHAPADEAATEETQA